MWVGGLMGSLPPSPLPFVSAFFSPHRFSAFYRRFLSFLQSRDYSTLADTVLLHLQGLFKRSTPFPR